MAGCTTPNSHAWEAERSYPQATAAPSRVNGLRTRPITSNSFPVVCCSQAWNRLPIFLPLMPVSQVKGKEGVQVDWSRDGLRQIYLFSIYRLIARERELCTGGENMNATLVDWWQCQVWKMVLQSLKQIAGGCRAWIPYPAFCQEDREANENWGQKRVVAGQRVLVLVRAPDSSSCNLEVRADLSTWAPPPPTKEQEIEIDR